MDFPWLVKNYRGEFLRVDSRNAKGISVCEWTTLERATGWSEQEVAMRYASEYTHDGDGPLVVHRSEVLK